MRFRYSVFTVMTPDLDLEGAASTLRSLGYDGVEWRVTEVSRAPPEKVTFHRGNRATVDASRVLEEAPRVRALSDRHGLAVPALGTYLRPGDLEGIGRSMEAARVLGCPQIRVQVPKYDGQRGYNEVFREAVEAYAAVEDLARRRGVRVNLEIHHGTICPSASAAHRFLSHFDSGHMGAIFDPGNMVHEGRENWQLGLELLGPYLSHVHVKNGLWEVASVEADGTRRWKPSWCGLREGQVHWGDVLEALARVGYEGWLSFEDFSEGDTMTKLRQNLAYMKSLEERL